MGDLQKRFYTARTGGRFVHNHMIKFHNKPTETIVHGVISMIRIMSLSQVKGGDVYKIAYARSYPKQFWAKDSLYLGSAEKQGKVRLGQ